MVNEALSQSALNSGCICMLLCNVEGRYCAAEGLALITALQARMGRAALRLGVRDVASAARVAIGTISRVEAGLPANESTLEAIQLALESLGLEFIFENGDGIGVRLRPGLSSDVVGFDWKPSFRSHHLTRQAPIKLAAKLSA